VIITIAEMITTTRGTTIATMRITPFELLLSAFSEPSEVSSGIWGLSAERTMTSQATCVNNRRKKTNMK
jgi:hypothetical protein